MGKCHILQQINGRQVMYLLWLLFLLNAFTFKESTVNKVQEGNTDVAKVKVINENAVSSQKKPKKLLFWNAIYGDLGFKMDDETAFQQKGCKVNNCIISKDKKLMPPESADAILFLYTNLCEIPKIYERYEHQRYVLLNDDPPVCFARNYYAREPNFGSFFNWTMSYRENADIIWNKGWIKKLTKAPSQTAMARKKAIKNFGKKKKLVAWYVARCSSKSKREGYIKELQEYINVDSYGPCGELTCPEVPGPPSAALQPCLDYLAENYKFVLTFERYICDDFITKRFFDVLRRDTVPIVFGGADYTKVAPAHSYIDALKMTPKQLANHLLMLDEDDRAYYRHFWWKGSYEVHTDYSEIFAKPLCDLCEKLHLPEPRKIYRDLDAWFHNSSKCYTAEDHGVYVPEVQKEEVHDVEIPWFPVKD